MLILCLMSMIFTLIENILIQKNISNSEKMVESGLFRWVNLDQVIEELIMNVK